jgi:hypothetical protein
LKGATRTRAQLGLLLLALITSSVLRAWWIQVADGAPRSDAKQYFNLAKQLASTGSYAFDDGATAFWPVGYPAALSMAFRAFGAKASVGRLFNLLLGVGSLICFYHAARGARLSRWAALLAVWLAALSPVYLTYTSLTVSETYFNFAMLLGCAIALGPRVTRRRLLLAGLVFGCAALTRPHGVLLPIVVGVLGADRLSAAGTRTLFLVCGLLLAMSPWWVRNALAFGAFVPISTNGGLNLFIGNNPHANGGYRLDAAVLAPVLVRFPDPEGPNGGQQELEYDRFAAQLARAYIREHPAEALARIPSKLAHMFTTDLSGLEWARPKAREKRARMLGLSEPLAIHNRALRMGAAIGLLWTLARCLALAIRRPLHGDTASHALAIGLLPAAVVASFTAIHIIYFGAPRFQFPLLPWFELSAATGLAGIYDLARRGLATCVRRGLARSSVTAAREREPIRARPASSGERWR